MRIVVIAVVVALYPACDIRSKPMRRQSCSVVSIRDASAAGPMRDFLHEWLFRPRTRARMHRFAEPGEKPQESFDNSLLESSVAKLWRRLTLVAEIDAER
jgi:hypothetical protein